MFVVPLDTADDPRLALFRGVSDQDLLRAHDAFVAEGRLVVRRLLTTSPLQARALLLTRPALEHLGDVVSRSDLDVPVFVVPQAVIDTVAGFNIHRGCLAVGSRPPRVTAHEMARVPAYRRLLVLERISNADNIGGIFRCAAALGGDAVLLDPRCADPLYRKAIRTSIGASLHVPFARADEWPGALDVLRAAGWRLMALTPRPGATSIERAAAEVERDARVALLLGSEGDGLSETALAMADLHVRIPVAEGVDSLNVAVAAGIALHRLAG